MKPKIVLIATSLLPTLESYERERLQGLDFLPRSAAEIARQVAINAGRIMLRIDDTHLNLLDLINYCRQGRRVVALTPYNLEENLSLAKLTPLTGIYLADSLRKKGFEARLMREAGCEYVHLGIESGDAEILEKMNKGIHPSQILKGIEILKGTGLVVSGTFIVGVG